MPRHADHEERKAELADAVCQIILEHGIDGVSVRSVAHQSGWSVGAIRYYFPKQEDLLAHALNRTIARTLSRISASENSDRSNPVLWGGQIIRATVPLSEDTRRDVRIWMAFVDRGLSQQNIKSLMDDVWRGGRHYSRRMVAAMAEIPLPQELDAVLDDPFLEETASVLHIMWNGIAFQGIMAADRMTPEELCRVTFRVLYTIRERVEMYMASLQPARSA